MTLRTSMFAAVLIAVACAVALSVGACGGSVSTTTLAASPTSMVAVQPTTTAAPQTTTPATAPLTSDSVTTAPDDVSITLDTAEDATEPADTELSEDAITYSQQLGGRSYEGRRLYLIIGASVGTEEEAQALLDKATPLFGDMQDYFVIQRSENFTGLNPGYFVLIEAHLNQPAAEDMDFAHRGFPDAYVKAVTVNTDDPIPVYEDVTRSTT